MVKIAVNGKTIQRKVRNVKPVQVSPLTLDTKRNQWYSDYTYAGTVTIDGKSVQVTQVMRQFYAPVAGEPTTRRSTMWRTR